MDVRMTDEDDPRLALVYQEAQRGLLQQQAAVESLHNRAATLIFASSFASRTPETTAGMYRDLALRIKADWHRNGRIVRRLREAFQLALVLLLLNILAWLFSIAGSPT